MSIEVMELFDIFSGTFGKEKAQIIVKDIETLVNDHKKDLATKGDLKEIELKIEQAKSSVIKWVSGLIVAQTAAIITLILLK